LLVVGNDIVDLTDPYNQGKLRDRRFRGRVFTAAEERRIDASPRPDVTLWAFWAAKESAFKAAVKLIPGSGFIPKEYMVVKYEMDLPAAGLSSLPDDYPIMGLDGEKGTGEDRKQEQTVVLYSGETVAASPRKSGLIATPVGSMPLEFTISEQWIHCLALGRRGYGDTATPDRTIQVVMESRGMCIEPSAAVRRAAVHHLADIFRTSPYYLEIRRARTSYGYGGPPQVFLAGRQTDVDISLTHDGSYIAFALVTPETSTDQ